MASSLFVIVFDRTESGTSIEDDWSWEEEEEFWEEVFDTEGSYEM